MKKSIMKILSFVVILALMLPMIAMSGLMVSAANVYTPMGHYSGSVWQIDAAKTPATGDAFIEGGSMVPSPTDMVAIGYKVTTNAQITIQLAGYLNIPGWVTVAPEQEALAYTVLEKNSNTRLYPAGDETFVTLKNNADDTNPARAAHIFTVNAKAGDEIIVLVKNLMSACPYFSFGLNFGEFPEGGGEEWLSTTAEFGNPVHAKLAYYHIPAAGFAEPAPPVVVTPPAGDSYKELAFYDGSSQTWQISPEKTPATGDAFIEKYSMVPSPADMTAVGYKVADNSLITVELSASLNVPGWVTIPAGTETMGFMILEKNSNRQLYPRDKAGFATLKNESPDTDAAPLLRTFSFQANAGDEIVLLVQNYLTVNAYFAYNLKIGEKVGDGEPTWLQTTEVFGNPVHGKLKYYYLAETDFTAPAFTPAAEDAGPEGKIEESDPGRKDIKFTPIPMEFFKTDTREWFVNQVSVSDQNSPYFGAVIQEGALAPTKNTLLARSYTASKDCNLSIDGHMQVQIPTWIDATLGETLVCEYLICNSKGQILYPKNAEGFGKIKKSDGNQTFSTALHVKKGEEIFLIARNSNPEGMPYLQWTYSIFETAAGETKTIPVTDTTAAYSGEQGKNNFRYYYINNDDNLYFTKGTAIAGTGDHSKVFPMAMLAMMSVLLLAGTVIVRKKDSGGERV